MPAAPMSNPTPEMQFDHLGVVVNDISAGREFLESALGVSHWTAVTEDPGLGVSVQFGTSFFGGVASGPTYELISPLGEGSPIGSALRAGKNILNHLAYLTADLAASGDVLRGQGCYPTGEPQPALAYGGRRVQFFVSPLRFIIELIESPGHRHKFASAGAYSGLDAIVEATQANDPGKPIELESILERASGGSR